MKKLTDYEATSMIDEIVCVVAGRYDIPSNFYGDCWNNEVFDLKYKLTQVSDEKELKDIRKQLEAIFISYAEAWIKDEIDRLDMEAFVITMKDRPNNQDWIEHDDLQEQIKALKKKLN